MITDDLRLTMALDQLKEVRRRSESAMATFIADLSTSPAHTFAWGSLAIQAAADLSVLDMLERDSLHDPPLPSDLDDVRRRALRAVVLRAKAGSASTSEIANIMERAKLAAWARILEIVGVE